MAILIDSDVLIQAERGVFGLDLWLESVSDQEVAIAAITVAELWHGVDGILRPHRQKRESFVLRHACPEYLQQFPIQTAGSRIRREYWAPAARPDEFNIHMLGPIELIREFRPRTASPVQ